MAEKIRFSEIRLDAVPSDEEVKSGAWTNPGHYTTNQALKYLKMDANSVSLAIKACDLYIPLSGKYTGKIAGPEITSEGMGPEDFDADDLSALMPDYNANLESNAIEGQKDYSQKRNTTINPNQRAKAVGVRGYVWNLHELLTDPKATPRKIETYDPDWKDMALLNEADLIKTFLYLNNKGPAPEAIARPAFEANGQLVMAKDAIPKEVINNYMTVYFGEIVKFGRKWLLNSKSGRNDKYSVARRAAQFANVLKVEPEDLKNMTYYYSLMFDFMLEGFHEVTGIEKVYKKEAPVDGASMDFNRGVFLQDKFQQFLSNPTSFDMDMLENGSSSLMNWVSKALIQRFGSLKQYVIDEGQRKFKLLNATSIEAESDKSANTNEHSGSTKFERDLFASGNYGASPEEEFEAKERMENLYKDWNTIFTEYDDLLCEEVPGHLNAAPKLRYIIAMLSYPRANSTTIAYAVGTKNVGGKGLTGVNKEDTKYGASIEKGRIRAGNLIKISQDVVNILRDYEDVLNSFLYLINTPLTEAHDMRKKILDMAKQTFKSEYFPKDAPDVKVFNGIDLFNSKHLDPEGLNSTTNAGKHNSWYLVDDKYVKHNQDYWEKAGHSFDEPEYEDVIDCLNDYTDAIVPVSVLPAIKKMAAEVDARAAEEERAAKARAIANTKKRDEDEAAAGMNGFTMYNDYDNDDAMAVNESKESQVDLNRMFEDIYASSKKPFDKVALFEEIRAEAKKAAKENK